MDLHDRRDFTQEIRGMYPENAHAEQLRNLDHELNDRLGEQRRMARQAKVTVLKGWGKGVWSSLSRR